MFCIYMHILDNVITPWSYQYPQIRKIINYFSRELFFAFYFVSLLISSSLLCFPLVCVQVALIFANALRNINMLCRKIKCYLVKVNISMPSLRQATCKSCKNVVFSKKITSTVIKALLFTAKYARK